MEVTASLEEDGWMASSIMYYWRRWHENKKCIRRGRRRHQLSVA